MKFIFTALGFVGVMLTCWTIPVWMLMGKPAELSPCCKVIEWMERI